MQITTDNHRHSSLRWIGVIALLVLLVGLLLVANTGTEDAVVQPTPIDADRSRMETVEKSGSDAAKKTPDAKRNTINWMGHWYKADKRYDLVLEIQRDFAFRNQDTRVNLQFPEQILGTNDKVAVARLIVEMIKQKRFDWDIVWMDNHIYQFVAEELNDPHWGRKHLVDFEEVPGHPYRLFVSYHQLEAMMNKRR